MELNVHTIGEIGKRFGISRSTLLYYDSIGLLSPSGRSAGNYRLYTEAEVRRMERINTFRNIGLSLDSIKELLQSDESSPSAILGRRLQSIGQEIGRLRRQQQIILKLLGTTHEPSLYGVMTKERWVKILSAAGLDEDGMQKWHAEFERSAPEAHQDFLESLGIEAREITLIREYSRAAGSYSTPPLETGRAGNKVPTKNRQRAARKSATGCAEEPRAAASPD
nr:MerR family transcriptional regulator [Propionivibrio soli]